MEIFEKVCLKREKVQVLYKEKCATEVLETEKIKFYFGQVDQTQSLIVKVCGEDVLKTAYGYFKTLKNTTPKNLLNLVCYYFETKRPSFSFILKNLIKLPLDYQTKDLNKTLKSILKTFSRFHHFSAFISDIFCLHTLSHKPVLIPGFSSTKNDYSKILSFLSLPSEIHCFEDIKSALYSFYQPISQEINPKLPVSQKVAKIKETYNISTTHCGPVTALAITNPLTLIATGSLDGQVAVWDLKKNEELCKVKPHKRCVYFLEFSPNGQVLLSGGSDQNLGILTLGKRKRLYKRKAHEQYMNCLSVSPDSRFAITCGDDAVVQLWDLREALLLSSLKGHLKGWKESLNIVSCDISSSQNIAITGGSDAYIRVWRLEWKCLEGSVTGHSSVVPRTENIEIELGGHYKYEVVTCVKFFHNNRFFLSGGEDGYVRVWDLAMKEKVAELALHRFGRFAGVKVLAISPDDQLAVSGGLDGCICFVNLSSNERIGCLELYKGKVGVSYLVITPDGLFVVTSGDDLIYIVEILSQRVLRSLDIHSNSVLGLRLVDHQKIASFSLDGFVKIWDFSSLKEEVSLQGHRGVVTAVAINHFTAEIVTGDFSGFLKFWKIKSQKVKAEKPGHKGWVSFIDLGLNGLRVISGGSDGVVKVWDSITRVCIRVVKCGDQSLIDVKMGRGEALISADREKKIYFSRFKEEVETIKGFSRFIQLKKELPEFKDFIDYLN